MLCRTLSFLTSGIICSTPALAEPLSLGSELPSITSKNQDGKTINLEQLKSHEWVLIYFYPKADTPGCTKQACSLRDTYATLVEKGVHVIGVSKDSVKDQKNFSEKFNLPFQLLADKEATVIKAFGVPQIPVIGMAHRQAFLFKKGVLHWRDLQASTDQQASDILSQINAPLFSDKK